MDELAKHFADLADKYGPKVIRAGSRTVTKESYAHEY